MMLCSSYRLVPGQLGILVPSARPQSLVSMSIATRCMVIFCFSTEVEMLGRFDTICLILLVWRMYTVAFSSWSLCCSCFGSAAGENKHVLLLCILYG